VLLWVHVTQSKNVPAVIVVLTVVVVANISLQMCVIVLTDVIGIVKSVDDVRNLTSKQGKELKKRDVCLVDESQVQIRLTLWANDVSLTSFFLHVSAVFLPLAVTEKVLSVHNAD